MNFKIQTDLSSDNQKQLIDRFHLIFLMLILSLLTIKFNLRHSLGVLEFTKPERSYTISQKVVFLCDS